MISTPFNLRLPSLLLILILSACAAAPEQPGLNGGSEDSVSGSDAEQDANTPLDESLGLLAPGLFLNVQQSLARQDYQLAMDQLGMVDTQSLNADALIVHALLSNRIFEANNDYKAALNLLANPALRSALPDTEARIKRQFLREATDLLISAGNYTQAASLVLDVMGNSPAKQFSADLKQRAWRALCRSSQGSFDHYLANNQDISTQGWLTLATVGRSDNSNLLQQLESTERWLAEWRKHPARPIAENLTRQFRNAEASRPGHLALMLPLSGRLATTGQAIRDGFLAEHYTSAKHAGSRPRITVMDSAAGTSVEQLYRRAEKLGADLVVGPLLKSNVEEIHRLTPRPVPILALNWIDNDADYDNFFQLSLGAEDETSQLVRVANFRTPGNALLVRAEGRWGTRVATDLKNQWQAMGNEIPAIAIFGRKTDLSTAIKQALDIGESEERARELSRILGVTSEFTPRRRQDIDAVFLLSARPDQARTIPPMLAFHYAGNIPIYSLSNSHDTRAVKGSLGDLEGLVFTDMPWVLQPGDAARAVAASGPAAMANKSRMHALGADAYSLHSRLNMLRHPELSAFRGQTGILSLGEANKLHRELLIAAVKSGRIELQTAAPQAPRPESP